jgi:hypothetical protein
MKKSRYTETQIIKVLKKVGGQPIRTQFGDAAIVAVHAQQSVLTLSAKTRPLAPYENSPEGPSF